MCPKILTWSSSLCLGYCNKIYCIVIEIEYVYNEFIKYSFILLNAICIVNYVRNITATTVRQTISEFSFFLSLLGLECSDHRLGDV